ncbi:MAG: APC family permease [Coriobacteriia bacterium]|nr:APC family permease [Coriobacteriia bacterium]
MNATAEETVQPQRTLSWRHGFFVALGVPVLILPSISSFAGIIGAFAIVVWLLSVFQGFMQNMAYGELASRYPNAPGLPGFAQAVFRGKRGVNEYGPGKFLGGLSAWCYWFAWNPVLSIFALLIGSYLVSLIPAFTDLAAQYAWFEKVLSLCVGAVIYTVLILINLKGVGGGAKAGYLLAALSLIPLTIISFAAFFSGKFDITNITTNWFPTDWSWNFHGVILFFGVMALAQWSACAWETAAIYAPQYKKPRKDIPKALFGCGIVCIFTYFIVQFACTGAMGVDGIAQHANDPMLYLARESLGNIGAIISIIMLLAAMVPIIQTALLGSSNAMASMAEEGNLPKILGKTNKHNVPIVAMIVISAFNMIMIVLGDSSASILAASALGYVVANIIALFSYVKAYQDRKKEASTQNPEEIFKAPKGWVFVALGFGLLQVLFYLAGIMVINVESYGGINTFIGVIIILCFIPLWLWAMWLSKRSDARKKAAGAASS